jgi:hypothetical protein
VIREKRGEERKERRREKRREERTKKVKVIPYKRSHADNRTLPPGCCTSSAPAHTTSTLGSMQVGLPYGTISQRGKWSICWRGKREDMIEG